MSVPNHIAMIMDGNRRWAEQHGLPVEKGHHAGAETVRRVVDYCQKHGVRNLTLYAFSTENWKRPVLEVKGLMELLSSFLGRYIDEMYENGVRLHAIGRLDKLPMVQRSFLLDAIKRTRGNKDFNLVLAISYGGRGEIADAAAKIAKEVAAGRMDVSEIDEALFRKFLYAPEIPDPDLLIRTSGEMRISNFLLWQISYSEIYFTNVLWPDFSEGDLIKALDEFSRRSRRFGGR